MTRSRKRKLQRLSTTGLRRGVASSLPLAPLLLAGTSVAQAQQDPEQSAILEEVVVTAQKQSENLQAVPMSISAFGNEKLEELRINNIEDAIKFVPSVTVASAGPGFSQVFMRGISSGSNGNHSGPSPSVGQYLDEQPITTIQGSVPIHFYDIARVEVLEGPQGTLYGASSQAGTIRTITNKPDASAFSASYDLQGSFVQSGDSGYMAEGYVNIPMGERTAVRLVGWYEHVPGYIDNVYGEMNYPVWPGPPEDAPEDWAPGPEFSDPVGYINVNNSKYVKKNYNDVDTYGGRALLKIDLNDSWSITPGIMGQQTDTGGVFVYDPNVGDLKVQHYNPEKSTDNWYQASLTVEGRIGDYELVYAGAYLDRNDFVASDYSDYAYWYDVLYGSGYYIRNDDNEFINPSQFIRGTDGYKMWSNEIRLSSPRDQRFRFVVGAFAQQSEHEIKQRYMIDDLADYLSVPLWPDTWWLTRQTRDSGSYAGFGEMYYDITDKLTATLGIRVFSTDDSLKGFFGFNDSVSSKYGVALCDEPWKPFKGAPCTNLNKKTDESGNTPKANLTYRFTDDKMAYLTYSKGFRPGGVNRNSTYPPYKADYLTNYEAGWKTEWLGGSLRFNGAVFFQSWDDVQFSYLGPNGLTIIDNAGRASSNGVEATVDWAAAQGLMLSAGFMWVDAKLTKSFCRGAKDEACDEWNFAPKDTALPDTPSFKGNVLARYNFNIGDQEANVQASYTYQDKVYQSLMPYDRQFTGAAQPYDTVDLSAGIKQGPYSFTLFVNNLFNDRSEYYRTAQCDVSICGQVTGAPNTIYYGVAQPRTIGMIFRQEF